MGGRAVCYIPERGEVFGTSFSQDIDDIRLESFSPVWQDKVGFPLLPFCA